MSGARYLAGFPITNKKRFQFLADYPYGRIRLSCLSAQALKLRLDHKAVAAVLIPHHNKTTIWAKPSFHSVNESLFEVLFALKNEEMRHDMGREYLGQDRLKKILR